MVGPVRSDDLSSRFTGAIAEAVVAVVPFAEEHLPEVTRMMLNFTSQVRRRYEPLLDYVRDLFIAAPTNDPEIPSLVSIGRQGTVEAFVGVTVCRVRYRDEVMRLAASGPLITKEDSRAAGGYLIGSFLRGLQGLSMTDGANEPGRRLFEAMGSEVVGLPSIRWVRPLRPIRTAMHHAADRIGRGHLLARVVGGLDTVATRRFIPGETAATSEAFDSADLPELMESIADRFEVVPVYNPEVVRWQFDHMDATRAKGPLRRLRIHDDRGTLLGWYIYHLKRGGLCRVVQIGSRPNSAAPVLAHLFRDAYEQGGGAVYGRLEPHFRAELRAHPVFLRPASPLVIIHSRDPSLRLAIHSGRAFLSRLEGENWSGFNLEPLP